MQKTPLKLPKFGEIHRLNWGCGQNTKPLWINSDRNTNEPSVNLPCDIRDGLPLGSETIDYAVSIHALPEVPYDGLIPVLQELRRVLKVGGVLRLCLPDLLKGVDAYRRGDSSYFAVPDGDAKSLGAKLVTQLIWYGYSRTLFTKEFIEEMLLKAGFRRVHHCSYKQTAGRFPEIVELDNRENESLYVEGVK